jgi:hypothetical protein
MRRRWSLILPAAATIFLLSAAPVLACGGLIGPNGAVNLLRTTTFAGYHAGVEHYITAFEYAGGGGAFGSLTPLPGVPTSVEKGGDWTLQRLVRETSPVLQFSREALSAPTAGDAEELMKVRIDALDLTVLRGGADEIGQWAKDHGFRLPPDAPEVLEFYAARSPIFLAAAFDPTAAELRGQNVGDGTPVHIAIPTPNPWVPLRILALGKQAEEPVTADVFLLTDVRPALLPGPIGRNGLKLVHSEPATDTLLSDLRSDRGMGWVPERAWLSKVEVDGTAGQLRYDLAVDASGQGAPSRVQAGLEVTLPPVPVAAPDENPWRFLPAAVTILAGLALIGLMMASRPAGRTSAS